MGISTAIFEKKNFLQKKLAFFKNVWYYIQAPAKGALK